MQLELIPPEAAQTLFMLEELGLDAKQIEDTYSCDTIGMSNKVRGAVKICDGLYFDAGRGHFGGDERRWEMLRLFTEEEFSQRYPDYTLYERYGDLPSPNWESDDDKDKWHGAYCGLRVSQGRNVFRVGAEADRIFIQTKGYEAAAAAHQEWMDAGCPEWDVWVQDHMSGTSWTRPFNSRDEALARASFADFKKLGWKPLYQFRDGLVAAVLVDPTGAIADSFFPPDCERDTLVKAMGYFMDDWTIERQNALLATVGGPKIEFGGVRADGWPNPTREAYEHLGDKVLDVAHDETLHELQHFAETVDALREVDPNANNPETGKPFSKTQKENIEKALVEIPQAILIILAEYESYFGIAGREIMKERAGITAETAPDHEPGGQLLLF